MTQEWRIRPRSRACHGCGDSFADGQICFSGLELTDNEWVRRDFCENCRQRQRRANPSFGAWRGRFRAPEEKHSADPVQRETVESLLRRLLDQDPTAHAGVIFVLAVTLERKRILVEREVLDLPDGARIRVYEHRRNGDFLRITDPRLRLDQLQPVQEEVIRWLKG